MSKHLKIGEASPEDIMKQIEANADKLKNDRIAKAKAENITEGLQALEALEYGIRAKYGVDFEELMKLLKAQHPELLI